MTVPGGKSRNAVFIFIAAKQRYHHPLNPLNLFSNDAPILRRLRRHPLPEEGGFCSSPRSTGNTEVNPVTLGSFLRKELPDRAEDRPERPDAPILRRLRRHPLPGEGSSSSLSCSTGDTKPNPVTLSSYSSPRSGDTTPLGPIGPLPLSIQPAAAGGHNPQPRSGC
jgi:hypothetical protein